MRIWKTENTFNHSWSTVIKASLNKYPNPITTSVIGSDVAERQVNDDGTLRTQKIVISEWNVPSWAKVIVGSPLCYAKETSEIDPVNKTLRATTVNLSLSNKLSFEEQMTYSQHPDDPDKTVLKQETIVSVFGVPLSSYLEDFITRNISVNASNGRRAIEWVIAQQTTEADKLT